VTDVFSSAPDPTHRLIPSQFPPIGLFDTVATAADLEAVMELAGWTNDRLVLERVRRLPQNEWVYGVPNASIVMAAFLHVAPGGMRFNKSELGAWYGAASLTTCAAEVGHHLRREAFARSKLSLTRTFRQYSPTLQGGYLDICRQQSMRSEIYNSTSYSASRDLGEIVRAAGQAGIIYDSLRHAGGVNIVAHRPRNILNVQQCDHFEITVQTTVKRIEVRKIS
jgi:hypothetical protein